MVAWTKSTLEARRFPLEHCTREGVEALAGDDANDGASPCGDVPGAMEVPQHGLVQDPGGRHPVENFLLSWSSLNAAFTSKMAVPRAGVLHFRRCLYALRSATPHRMAQDFFISSLILLILSIPTAFDGLRKRCCGCENCGLHNILTYREGPWRHPQETGEPL